MSLLKSGGMFYKRIIRKGDNAMSNKEIFNESQKYMPGGVNSPVRAFNGMDVTPPIIKRGNGPLIWDEEGKEYIDFVLAWGPMILGHCNKNVVSAIENVSKEALAFGAPTKLELEMSRFLCETLDSVDMVRMVNSGTEATMSAVKLARGYTGKNKIVKFAGCYHGHFDGFLVQAGSEIMTTGIPGSAGVPQSSIENTLVAEYNSIESIEEIFRVWGNEIAGVIIEPVAGNMGVIQGDKTFIKRLRELCNEYKALLIFDEVMSGFRVAYKGATSLYDVEPDLITFAKIMGGGLPCGAYGGRREIMEKLSPVGPVYQAGTMSGNPVVMAAGLATLKELYKNKNHYEHIEEVGSYLQKKVEELSNKYYVPIRVNRVGGMMTLFFTSREEVTSFEDVKSCDANLFKRYFLHMLREGINLPPSQYEALFLCTEHTKAHMNKFICSLEGFLKEVSRE